MPRNLQNTLALNAEITAIDAGNLILRYSLVNAGGAMVWVFNQLFDTEPSGKYRMNSQRVYIRMPGDGILRISKELFEVPPLLSVAFPEITCVTGLEPGGAIEETIQLAFPLQEVTPYSLKPLKTITRTMVRSIQFVVGVLPNDGELVFLQGTDINGQPFRYPRYGQANERQVRLEVNLALP